MKKLISWNVNGLRACVGKGFLDYFKEADADVFCLQETKLQEGQIDLDLPGYHQYWNYAQKKGYSGTAMFTKEEPVSVRYGLGIEEHDMEGRVIAAEFPEYFVVTCYTPNSQDGLARLDYRMEWENAFLAYLKKLEEEKPVIFCPQGDRSEEPQEQPEKRGLHRRGARKVYGSFRSRIYRHVPVFLSGPGGDLLLVVLPFLRPGEERGVAHRLLLRLGEFEGPAGQRGYPYGGDGVRPLSGGVGD